MTSTRCFAVSPSGTASGTASIRYENSCWRPPARIVTSTSSPGVANRGVCVGEAQFTGVVIRKRP